MPDNTAAYLPETGQPLEVRAAPYPALKENEIIVHVRAIAINPCDYAMQKLGPTLFPSLKYPAIIGEDVAGDVVEVGPGVNGLKVGDRVVGYSESAFQTYAPVREHLATIIPNSVSYESASVIPLGMSTALMGLFPKDLLALEHPTTTTPKSTGKTLLIWGGSTSVGSNAIQAAVASGYEVISTASPKNFPYVEKLGASRVFDYNSATITEDLVAAFKGKQCAGALAIADVNLDTRKKVADACMEVVGRSEGNKFVALTMFPPSELYPGVEAKFVNAAGAPEERKLGHAIFRDWLPKALEEGKFIPAPEPLVVGKGLEAVQGGMDLLKEQGVSAKKVVVSL